MGSGCCRFGSSKPSSPHPPSGQSSPRRSPESKRQHSHDSEMEELLESLQDFVGEEPRFEVKEFENFSKLVRAKVFLVKPKTVEEVQKVVRTAAQFKLKVRIIKLEPVNSSCLHHPVLLVITMSSLIHNSLQIRCHGATHSWSPLFADEGQILIDGNKLERQEGPKIQLNKRIILLDLSIFSDNANFHSCSGF